MKKSIFTTKKSAFSFFAFVLSLLTFLLWFTEIKAQNFTKSEQTNVKSLNNVSTWVADIKAKNNTVKDTTYKNSKKIQGEQSNVKQLKNINASNYYHPETGSVKLENTPGSVELTESREANSRTFLNPDGSFTKVQTNGRFHYKDEKGQWLSIDGKLSQNEKNSDIYEISSTDLPISIDLSNGKTMMALEKNQYISFGAHVELVIMDNNFNEIDRTSANKSKSNNVKEKEILIKNFRKGNNFY